MQQLAWGVSNRGDEGICKGDCNGAALAWGVSTQWG